MRLYVGKGGGDFLCSTCRGAGSPKKTPSASKENLHLYCKFVIISSLYCVSGSGIFTCLFLITFSNKIFAYSTWSVHVFLLQFGHTRIVN